MATTRARDHLVLSLRRPAQRSGNAAATHISNYMADYDDLWQAVELDELAASAENQPPGSDDQSRVIDETLHSAERLEQWVTERKHTIDEFSRPQFVAATGLSRAFKDEEEEQDSPEPWRRGRAGTSVGRAVHAVLQSIDLAAGEGVEHRARAQAVAEGVPDREEEIVRLARVAVDSDIVRRAVASKRIWREVPVAAPVGDGSLHGFIDLLFEEEDGLVVVDYKTDSVTEAQFPEVTQRYRLQGGAYAHAVAQITGRPVKEMVFLYLQPNREEPLLDLRGAMDDARAAAQSLLKSPPTNATE